MSVGKTLDSLFVCIQTVLPFCFAPFTIFSILFQARMRSNCKGIVEFIAFLFPCLKQSMKNFYDLRSLPFVVECAQ